MRKRPSHRHERHAEKAGPQRPTPHRWLLHVVVFVCGAVLMGLEIVGSRILAPHFGNSIFVWGSLISVVLAALSLGYWLGGIVADRWPRLSVLGVLIAIPGIMIAVLPFGYPALNRAIAIGDLGARLGPLISCVVLFLVPSVFLGTISPFAVRLQARAVTSVGTTAGGLYAVSTAGSIAGTLLTAFYLIVVMGVANIVHGLGLTLLLTAAAVFLAFAAVLALFFAGRAPCSSRTRGTCACATPASWPWPSPFRPSRNARWCSAWVAGRFLSGCTGTSPNSLWTPWT